MLYNAFKSIRHSKVPLPVGASAPHVIHVPWINLTQYPKLHLNQFSLFAQLTAGSPYTLLCVLKRD